MIEESDVGPPLLVMSCAAPVGAQRAVLFPHRNRNVHGGITDLQNVNGRRSIGAQSKTRRGCRQEVGLDPSRLGVPGGSRARGVGTDAVGQFWTDSDWDKRERKFITRY